MSGFVPIDFSGIIFAINSLKLENQNIFAELKTIRELLTPLKENTGENEEMPIPLEVKLFLGTGTLLGEDIPLSTFISQSSVWEQILRDTVDCDQTALKTVPGHKFGYLKSFQPGDTYTFNVNVDPSFTDFDGTKIEPIDVFLIDTNLQSLAIDFAIALAADIGVANISSVIPDFIGYAKDRGWVKRLPTTGGSFTITPSNSDRFIHFSANTSTSTEGCVITDFNSVNNTFLLGGY